MPGRSKTTMLGSNHLASIVKGRSPSRKESGASPARPAKRLNATPSPASQLRRHGSLPTASSTSAPLQQAVPLITAGAAASSFNPALSAPSAAGRFPGFPSFGVDANYSHSGLSIPGIQGILKFEEDGSLAMESFLPPPAATSQRSL